MEYRAWLLLAVAAQQIILSSSLKLSKESPGPGSVLEASDGCLYQLVSLLPESYTANAAPTMALLSLVSAPREGYDGQPGLLRQSVDTHRDFMVNLDGKPCKPTLRAHILPRTFKVVSHPAAVVSNHTSSSLLRFAKIQQELEEQGLKVAKLAHDKATKDAFQGMLTKANATSISNSNASSNSTGNATKKTEMTGQLKLDVVEAEAFTHDKNCEDAIRMSVAKKLNIPLEYVKVDFTLDDNGTNSAAKNSSLLQQHQESSSVYHRVTASIKISLPEGSHMDLEAWREDATADSFNEEVSRQFRQAALNGNLRQPHVVDVTLGIERSAYPPSPLTAQRKAQREIGSQVAVAADKGLKPWTDAMLNAAKVRDQHAARGNTLAKAAFAAGKRDQSLEAQARQWRALPGAHAKFQAGKLQKKANHFMAAATDADKKAKDSFKIAKSIDDSLPAYHRQAQQGAYHEIAKVAADVQAPLPSLALM